MNSSALLHAINDLKDEYIDEADEIPKGRSIRKQILGFGAAAVVVFAITAGALILRQQSTDINSYDDSLISDTASGTLSNTSSVSSNQSSSETALLVPWKDLSIAEQYPELDFNNTSYSGKNTTVEEDSLGQSLGLNHLLTGYDEIFEEARQTYGEVFEIKGISSECAVAVKHKDSSEYYVYVNAYYRPETLGQFIDDLSLEDNLEFTSIWFEYTDDNNNLTSVECSPPSEDVIWNMLFSDINAEIVDLTDQPTLGVITAMDIGIDIPILGYKNISVAITEDGYLKTNILDTEKAFIIGVDAVNEFVSYVKENCNDIKTVYTTSGCLDSEQDDGSNTTDNNYTVSSAVSNTVTSVPSYTPDESSE